MWLVAPEYNIQEPLDLVQAMAVMKELANCAIEQDELEFPEDWD